MICQYTGWKDCRKIDAPLVVESRLIFAVCGIGCRGATPKANEPYIFIVPGLDSEQRREVIFHETVHFVARELGIAKDRCESEALARALTALILNTEYDHTWKVRYGCNESA